MIGFPEVPARYDLHFVDYNAASICMRDDGEYVLHEDYAELRAAAEKLLAENKELLRIQKGCHSQIEGLLDSVNQERLIVDRIWDLFGRPSFESLKGKSIYDLITDMQAENEALRKKYAVADNEVLFAITRPEDYDDVHPDLLAHDCFKDFVEYRVIDAAMQASADTAPDAALDEGEKD